jgi:hypothetical protein
MNDKANPWTRLRHSYEDWHRHGFPVQIMLTLLDWIHGEKLESELFAVTSHRSLILSNKADFVRGQNTLQIGQGGLPVGKHAACSANEVLFYYTRQPGAGDFTEVVATADAAIETFRMFLVSKFGLGRPVDARQTLSPFGSAMFSGNQQFIPELPPGARLVS